MQKLFLLLIFLTGQAIAQDTLLLINGRTIIVSSVDLSNNTIAYRSMDPDSKLKNIGPDRVFSVLYRDGSEKVIYQPDSLDPIDFKVSEMRNFIQGERDARRIYRNNFVKILGLGVGAGSALTLGFYGLVGPPLYSTVVQQIPSNSDKILSIKVSGDATKDLGLTPGTYLNEITGSSNASVIKANQKLKICSKLFKFEKDMSLDDAISLINTKKECTGVNAANQSGKILLYKTQSAAILNDPSYREGFEKRVREYKVRSAWISGIIGFIVGSATFIIID